MRSLLVAALVGAVVWVMSQLFDVARFLSIDYFDSFEYLANARILAELGGHPIEIDYSWRRPPFVSILQALVYPAGGDFAAAVGAFRSAHLLAWSLSACALGVVYLLLRRSHERVYAVLGVALLAANPMFLHLVPFALVDVPAMLMTALALATYLVARRRSSGTAAVIFCGLALGAAMATKYNLLLLVPCLLAFGWVEGLAQRSTQRRGLAPGVGFRLRTLTVIVIGTGAWMSLQLLLRFYVEGAGLEGLFRVVESFVGEIDYVGLHVGPDREVAFSGWDDPRSEYIEEIYQVTPFALLVAFFAGVFVTVRRGTPADRLHLVWLTLFLTVMSFVILTKASRYLLPVLPSLIHLQLRGLHCAQEAAAGWLAERSVSATARRTALFAGTAMGLLAVLWLPVAQAREQLWHFGDAIYRMEFVERLAREIHREVPDGAPILWRGNLYAVYPPDPVFFPHDEAFYFYHLAPHVLEFFLNRPIGGWERGRPYRRSDLVEAFPRGGAVITHDARFHMTHLAADLPPSPPALLVDLISRQSFVATRRSASVLKDVEDGRRRIGLRRTAAGFAVPTNAATRGWQVFYRATADGPLQELGEPLATPPQRLELLRVERIELRYRD